MNNLLHQITARLRYKLHAHRRGGFGIHSPFLFHWLNSVLYEQTPYYAYRHLRNIRRALLRTNREIHLQGLGTGSERTTTIKQIAATACSRQKYAELLFRIANNCQAQHILELGTNLGLTTLHLAAANKHAHIRTLEGEPALCNFAQQLFDREQANNIDLLQGNIDHTLAQTLQTMPAIDLAFFDANHTEKATRNYFEQCLPHAHEHTIFIFDDIHRSPEMERAWAAIKANKRVRVTVDLFQMGIAFFNSDLRKEDYIVTF